VLDELSRGVVDEDEDAQSAPTDRSYWEHRASPQTVGLADQLLKVANQFDPSLDLTYNKFYIGFSKDGRPYNFCVLKPKRNFLRLEIKLPQSADTESKIESAGLDATDYNPRRGYLLRLSAEDVRAKQDQLKELMQLAHNYKGE
jgi:hypothetical protein